ncbi:uncharacterized protein LOC111814408 [Octodon degus]|uniref:Uncharacterized protein LOC111814408 n=1 Tax=Octodon degus TaxID=10160 RepID=A0A6P6DU86_OCTDE|nr:uncharacterized protein LOC111814408 [Octodon degus]
MYTVFTTAYGIAITAHTGSQIFSFSQMAVTTDRPQGPCRVYSRLGCAEPAPPAPRAFGLSRLLTVCSAGRHRLQAAEGSRPDPDGALGQARGTQGDALSPGPSGPCEGRAGEGWGLALAVWQSGFGPQRHTGHRLVAPATGTRAGPAGCSSLRILPDYLLRGAPTARRPSPHPACPWPPVLSLPQPVCWALRQCRQGGSDAQPDHYPPRLPRAGRRPGTLEKMSHSFDPMWSSRTRGDYLDKENGTPGRLLLSTKSAQVSAPAPQPGAQRPGHHPGLPPLLAPTTSARMRAVGGPPVRPPLPGVPRGPRR